MDPKTLSNLDPKLRETYERVMGSSAPAGGAPTAPTPTDAASVAPSGPVDAPTIPTPSAAHATEPTLSAPTPTPVVSPPPVSTEPNPFQTPVIPTTEPAAPLPSPASVNQTEGNPSPMIRILYIAGAIVFFLVYTFFWVKVFNLQWPF